jgi:hypothetical protein
MIRPVSIASVLLLGCASSLPSPPVSAHGPDEFIDVPYPPPPVRADIVPPRPHSSSVWIDGEWHWQGTRWGWRRGAWVIPPEGATFARWKTQRDGGRVQHATSVFHLADGQSVDPSELRERRRIRHRTACTEPEPASFDQRADWPTEKPP